MWVAVHLWGSIGSLIHPYDIPSSMWVAVCFLGFIWIADMHLWNSIQNVGWCMLSRLYLNHWDITFIFFLVCTYLLLHAPLALLSWQTCILQLDHIESCVDVQFNVRPYFILLLMYLQLHRHPPCLVSLVRLIFFFFWYSSFLTARWIAILICLEHSFWIAQKGSNASGSFTKAWKFYLQTQHTLVNQELDDYFRSKGSNDWFTTQYYPSKAECAECRKIVLNNLLCKSSSCFYQTQRIADIFLAHHTLETFAWSLWDLLG